MYSEVLAVGILVSLAFSQLIGISPAGLITVGYLALNIGSPYKILLTLLVSAATLGLYQLISRFTILYGQRRFALMILLSLGIGAAVSLLPVSAANFGVIGYVIPGLIAKECSRQGIPVTLLALAGATAVTVLLSLLLGAPLL